MAHILLLTPQLPYPPHQGTTLRNWHVLRALAARHDVTLLSFSEGYAADQLRVIEETCAVLPPVPVPPRSGSQRLAQLATSRLPDLANRLASPVFRGALQGALAGGRFDAVQVEGIELARYIGDIRAGSTARVVLDCHNAETELQRRAMQADVGHPRRWPAAAYSAVQVARLGRFERQACLAADHVVAVSETDRGHLLRQTGIAPSQLTVIPNAIDVEEYAPEANDPEEHFNLVFTGKMDYRPNVDAVLWFAEAVWPRILASRPDATWAIVGQRPHARLAPLRAVTGITVTGRVARVQPYLAGADLAVMPFRVGSGTRLKIIEAMAAGKAIVSTRVGAEGFPVESGRELVLTDTADEMARAINSLLADPGARQRLGAAARAFARQYDWRQVMPRFYDVYDALLGTE